MVLVVVMGVSGSGKSTVGTLLADKLGWKFYEGDDYHPEENKKKMAEGIPLTDQLVRCLKLQENIEDTAVAQGVEMSCVPISKETLLDNVATSKHLHLSRMQDRIPWLCHLHDILMREHASGQSVILACSALKKVYRCILENGEAGCQSLNNQQEEMESAPRKILFVHLAGPIELIASRLEKRRGHFMPPSLLQSQFDTLEPPCAPENFITVNLEKSVSETVSEIERHLKSLS